MAQDIEGLKNKVKLIATHISTKNMNSNPPETAKAVAALTDVLKGLEVAVVTAIFSDELVIGTSTPESLVLVHALFGGEVFTAEVKSKLKAHKQDMSASLIDALGESSSILNITLTMEDPSLLMLLKMFQIALK